MQDDETGSRYSWNTCFLRLVRMERCLALITVIGWEWHSSAFAVDMGSVFSLYVGCCVLRSRRLGGVLLRQSNRARNRSRFKPNANRTPAPT